MKITSVTYARLQTLHGYNNERVGATADVEAHEMAEDVFDQLKAWVKDHLTLVVDTYQLRDDIDTLERRKLALERDFDRAEQQWEAAKAFLEKHGVTVGEVDDIPF